MNNYDPEIRKLSNGEQRIECTELGKLIQAKFFDEVYIVLYEQNAGYPPILVLLTSQRASRDRVISYLGWTIGAADEHNRHLDVDVQDRVLYINCGAQPPSPERLCMYTKVCPHCLQLEMHLTEFRQGEGDNDQTWYSCDSCHTQVYINVTTLDDEEE